MLWLCLLAVSALSRCVHTFMYRAPSPLLLPSAPSPSSSPSATLFPSPSLVPYNVHACTHLHQRNEGSHHDQTAAEFKNLRRVHVVMAANKCERCSTQRSHERTRADGQMCACACVHALRQSTVCSSSTHSTIRHTTPVLVIMYYEAAIACCGVAAYNPMSAAEGSVDRLFFEEK